MELLRLLRSLFRRNDVEQELNEELQFHLQRQIEEHIESGLTPQEARLAALRAFGGVEQQKEKCRDALRVNLLDNINKDLRFALRRLAHNPGFTIAAVLTIALGIGVNTAIFSIYNAVALKPLHVSQPDRVVRIKRWFEKGYSGDQQYFFSYGEYAYSRDQNNVFTGVVAASAPTPVLADSGRFQAQIVSANYFDVLGIRAQVGRTFLPGEDRLPGGNPVIVLSHFFWLREFKGDPRALGQTLKIRGTTLTVIGVAPETFSGTSLNPVVPDFWTPLSMEAQLVRDRDWLNDPNDREFNILARLKPGTSPAAAQAQVDALVRQYATTYRERDKTSSITVEHTALFGNVDDVGFRTASAAALLVVGLVLIVACANLANMMLAHGASRQREIGIRRALGAGRARIVCQLVTESLVLALLGSIAGLQFSSLAIKLLWDRITTTIAAPMIGGLTVTLDLAPDVRVFGYALLLCVITVLFFGLVPALQVTRPDLVRTLKDEGGFFAHRMRHSRLRSVFIGAQVTISMLFLLTAGLLMRGLLRSQDADTGFETQDVFTISTDFGRDNAVAAAVQLRLIERLRTRPEIRNVARGHGPLFGTWTPTIVVNGRTERTLASYASDTYFDLLGIPILRGRGFTDQEARDGAPVAVISESTAQRFWPAQDPLSKHFKLDVPFRGDLAEFEVIGITRDVRFANPTRVDPAHVYLPTDASNRYGLLFRTQGNTDAALSAVRKIVESVDASLIPYLQLINLEQGPLAVQRFFARFVTFFLAALAILALALAGVGIYAVMAFIVGQRTKEIGIKMALGASSRALLRSIVLEGMPPVFAGASLGFSGAIALSWFFHRSIASPGSSDFLQGVPFYDPVVFVGLSGFVIGIAVLASLVPAQRALRIDPMVALRHE